MESSAALATEGGGELDAGASNVVPLSDRVLLERHVRGDKAAFGELMKMYGSTVYGFLARAGVPAGERDDLFQEVFVKVHRALSRGLPDGPVRPWLLAIAVNAARDSFRKARVRSIVRTEERAGDDVADELRNPRPDRAAEARETAAWIEEEVAKLPLDQREVLVLCVAEGMSLEDAAAALHAPVNTVKTRLRRARLFIADALERRKLIVDREGSR